MWRALIVTVILGCGPTASANATKIPVAVDIAICSAFSLVSSEIFEEDGAATAEGAIISKLRAQTLLNWAIEMDRADGVASATTLRTRDKTATALRTLASTPEGKLAVLQDGQKRCADIVKILGKLGKPSN